MWAVGGDFGEVGMPVFDASLRAIGVLTLQQGVEGAEASSGGGGLFGIGDLADRVRPFVLPASAVEGAVTAAKAKVPEALASAAKAAAEGAPAAPPETPR